MEAKHVKDLIEMERYWESEAETAIAWAAEARNRAAKCREWLGRLVPEASPSAKPSAREAIEGLTGSKPQPDPLEQPMSDKVMGAIATYGDGEEPPMTPRGYLEWDDTEHAQWSAYVSRRW